MENKSGYGREPGYRGDVEFGYGDEYDDEEEDVKLLFWGDCLGRRLGPSFLGRVDDSERLARDFYTILNEPSLRLTDEYSSNAHARRQLPSPELQPDFSDNVFHHFILATDDDIVCPERLGSTLGC
ncbi:hypothetical protein DY000_02059973 [Brassica cretica]|uniref:Uncharacterized protein n=1 Tax=Brassica cretica TaxID=69181 RepID=A0ABQ7AU98_BRACR|nr:hypothetical protein DY000_02059973 [Brassica cretica]